ncbi:HK97 gp10 family phage protein [Mesobaculum littorinae]|uniref:HK97 gp10 family phage protein n=1 Tax=Mesobaculum littorinae TaxID=2486419 RepID=A0A438AM24_9RHOB|nr:HK97-gp10 family putative phage morphogenesis protein [Mesobaculum littorinae]RVV99704.1 HK97 gp10 family phage protein [Mesobaculum littorinae]
MSNNSVRFSVSGLADLEKSLSNLSKGVGKSVLRRSLDKAAKPMADLARDLAPVDDGELRDSIKIGRKLNKKEQNGQRRLAPEQRDAVELFVGPSYLLGAGGRHGHLVEFGTAPHDNKGQFAGTRHPGTAPQPFMRPAYDAEAGPTIDRLKPILWSEVEKAAKRAARKAAKAAAAARQGD